MVGRVFAGALGGFGDGLIASFIGQQGHLRAGTLLEAGPQPAHAAGGLLGSAPGVQRHQALQQRVGAFGQLQVGPAVGLQHGAVQLVVQALEHTRQAQGVNRFVLGAQRLAAAQLRQHVVERGQRHLGVRRLSGLAVGVDLLGQAADLGAQFGG